MTVHHSVHVRSASAPLSRTAPSRRHLWLSLLFVILLVMALYGAVVRPWYMRWGATDQELLQALPGDALISPGAIISTRALTINAPPETIWPWLVQLGQGRGGFYSYTWLENLFAADMINAEQVDPQLQAVKVGDVLSFGQGWYTTSISLTEPNRVLVLRGWIFYLQPVDAGATRLIIRYPYVVGDGVFDKLFYFGIFEPAHFVMESGMMMGIKARSERG